MSKATDMFFAKLKEDRSFTEKVFAVKEEAVVLQLAKEEGIELTLEDLNHVKNILLAAKEAKAKTSELSEEELEHVAGGATPAIGGSAAASAASIEHCETAASIVISGAKDAWSAISGW